jgi:hypothetical protein
MPRTFKSGDIFRVGAGSDAYAYGVMLSVFPYVAFYPKDTEFRVDDPPTEPPMFIVLVERSAYARGGWGAPIGRLPESLLPSIPRFFWQSEVNKADCKIVEPIKHRVTASPADCVGLEPEAIWAKEHIESRILDAYAGRPNRFLESLRVKL